MRFEYLLGNRILFWSEPVRLKLESGIMHGFGCCLSGNGVFEVEGIDVAGRIPGIELSPFVGFKSDGFTPGNRRFRWGAVGVGIMHLIGKFSWWSRIMQSKSGITGLIK